MVLPTIHHECGHKHWTNFSQTYWLALYKNEQVPQNIQQKQCKVSYSGLLNFANMTTLHNNRILCEGKTQDQPKCNCRQKDTCPLEGNCLDKEYTNAIWKRIPPVTESNTTVLQKIHLKTNFISTTIASSTRVRKTTQNYLSISGKWKEKILKNQSCIGQLLIMPNHIRVGLKGATYV